LEDGNVCNDVQGRTDFSGSPKSKFLPSVFPLLSALHRPPPSLLLPAPVSLLKFALTKTSDIPFNCEPKNFRNEMGNTVKGKEITPLGRKLFGLEDWEDGLF
jgi:hypothetical protein